MTIDRYISTEISRPLLGGLGLLVLIFVAYSSARYLTLAADGQLPLQSALALIGLNTLVALEVLLPSALFFSALFAIGRLYREAEMYALQAAGVSRLRILESVLKLSLLVALITGFISIQGRPWAYREIYALEAQAAAHYDLKKMAAGEFVELAGSDYVFYAGDVDAERGLHRDIFLFKRHPDHARSEILVARSAALPTLHPEELMQAEFDNGYQYLLDEERSQDVTTEFGQFIVRLWNRQAQEKYHRKAETTTFLADSRNPKDIAEFQWRVSTPLATVLLGLLAVPLAYNAPRESPTRNVFIALLIYVSLFTMTSVLRTWVEQERLQAMPGLWLAYGIQALLLAILVRNPGIIHR